MSILRQSGQLVKASGLAIAVRIAESCPGTAAIIMQIVR
jgi:hypothetical protein